MTTPIIKQGPFLVYLLNGEMVLEPAPAGLFAKGGGSTIKLGDKYPKTVRGPTNSQGVAVTAARSDHQHRLEVEVLKSSTLIGARPAINFTGTVVGVSDDAINDRTVVHVSGGAEGVVVDAQTIPNDASLLKILPTLSFTTTAQSTNVRVSFTGAGRLWPDGSGDPATSNAGIQYRLLVNNQPVPGSTRSASIEGVNMYLTYASSGVVTLAAGTHELALEIIAVTVTNLADAVVNILPEGSLDAVW